MRALGRPAGILTSTGCWTRSCFSSSSASSTTGPMGADAKRNSTLLASNCAISAASPMSRFSRSLSSLMMVSSSCLLLRRMTGAAEQRRHRRFDGGERSAKLMRDRIEQDGTQLLAFAGSLGAAEFFDGAGALDGDGHQAADGLQGLPREHGPGDAHASHNAHAHAERHEGQLMGSVESWFTAHANQLEIARFQSVDGRDQSDKCRCGWTAKLPLTGCRTIRRCSAESGSTIRPGCRSKAATG